MISWYCAVLECRWIKIVNFFRRAMKGMQIVPFLGDLVAKGRPFNINKIWVKYMQRH